MKLLCSFLVSITSIITLTSAAHAGEQEEILAARKMNFNAGWVFKLGDAPNASKANFDDSKWESVKIPRLV